MPSAAVFWREARVTAPPLFALLTFAFLLTIWPALVGAQTGRTQYWLARSAPGIMLVLPAALSLALVAMVPLHLRRAIAIIALIVFGALAANFAWAEYERLAPYVAGGTTWRRVLRFADGALIAGGVMGFVCCGIAARLSLNLGPNLKRTNKATFGDADWMGIAEAQALFPPAGGLVVGEGYRVDRDIVGRIAFEPRDESTWGQGGRSPIMTYPANFGSGHALFVSGSGGFKTTSVTITTAATYGGSLVLLDPPCEVSSLVSTLRKRDFGRDVVVLDPRTRLTGFNVLDWIVTSRQPEQDIATVAHWLLSDSARIATDTGNYFQNQAHNLLTGCLAYVMFSPEYENRRNLRSLRSMIADPEPVIRSRLKEIHATFDNAFVRETLGVFINMTEATFSGVYSTASKDTQWLSFPEYADLVCGGSFKSAEIASGTLDVFINLRTEALQTYPGIARVIVGALINAMIQADGRHKERVLFLLDEANLLGYMKTLETARDIGRKYGVALALLYQSVGQVRKHFGPEGKEAWFDGVGLSSFAAIGDIAAAREISALCGEITIEVGSRSRSLGFIGERGAGRRTETVNYQRRPLIMPHEIIQAMRADEQIVIVKGRPPLRCGRAIYFRRPELNAKLAANRFARLPQE